MSKRHPNPRLAKANRCYEVYQAAKVFGVHRNTVLAWIKAGLPTVADGKRPYLIPGRDLAGFLAARKAKGRQPLKPGEIYCVRCHKARDPAGGMADIIETKPGIVNLAGLCPNCECVIYRRINPRKLELVRGNLDVRPPQAVRHIDATREPSLNCDLNPDGQHHDEAQRQ